MLLPMRRRRGAAGTVLEPAGSDILVSRPAACGGSASQSTVIRSAVLHSRGRLARRRCSMLDRGRDALLSPCKYYLAVRAGFAGHIL